jgi:hypothetical protein
MKPVAVPTEAIGAHAAADTKAPEKGADPAGIEFRAVSKRYGRDATAAPPSTTSASGSPPAR